MVERIVCSVVLGSVVGLGNGCLPAYASFAAHVIHLSKRSPDTYSVYLLAATATVSPVKRPVPLLNMEQFYSNFSEVLMPSIATYCCPTGEGMLEHGLDRHEQLKLQAQKQGLLEGSSALELPACCNVDPANECGDDQEDLDALMY